MNVPPASAASAYCRVTRPTAPAIAALPSAPTTSHGNGIALLRGEDRQFGEFCQRVDRVVRRYAFAAAELPERAARLRSRRGRIRRHLAHLLRLMRAVVLPHPPPDRRHAQR